jgi:tripartite-type tricarboxylate transporter receptor subunit TctC
MDGYQMARKGRTGPAPGMPLRAMQKLESASTKAMEPLKVMNMVQKLDLITVYYNSKEYGQYLKTFWTRCEKTMEEIGIIKEAATSPY